MLVHARDAGTGQVREEQNRKEQRKMKKILSERKTVERKTAVENSVFNRPFNNSLWKTLGERRMTNKEGKRVGYSHLTFCCPYYEWDARKAVGCEGGRIELPDRSTAEEFFQTYCGDVSGWQRCSVARAISRFYERREDE